MRVRVYVTKRAALMAGVDSYGYRVVEVPAATLTMQERYVLSMFGGRPNAHMRQLRPSPGATDPAADFYIDDGTNYRDPSPRHGRYKFRETIKRQMEDCWEPDDDTIRVLLYVLACHVAEVNKQPPPPCGIAAEAQQAEPPARPTRNIILDIDNASPP